MKNKPFSFWWKSLAQPPLFPPKRKRFKSWRFRACLPLGRDGEARKIDHF
jgi:hypothetical protein